jgi:GWxTD domain-containing protein
MNSRYLKQLTIIFPLFFLLTSGSRAAEISFYPGEHFKERAGVFECREGVTFTSAVFPFQTIGDSLRLVLSTQVENRNLLFVKSDLIMTSAIEFSLYLRNEGAGFVLSRTWEESLKVDTETEASSTIKSVFQTVFDSPAGGSGMVFSHEITDQNAVRTGIIGPTKLTLSTDEDESPISGPYPFYAKEEMEECEIKYEAGSILDKLLFNPGKSYGYGIASVGFYLEMYRPEVGPVEPLSARFRVRFGESEWNELCEAKDLDLPGTSSISIFPSSEMLELGEGVFRVDVVDNNGSPVSSDSSLFFMSLTEEWILSKYEGAIKFLDYILSPAERKRFEKAEADERRALWRSFWKERDPIPATPQNERLVEYFRRIQIANARFSNPILEGWKSDMGRVYVLLGPPEEVYLRDVGQRLERHEIWMYDHTIGFQLVLYFVDRGFTGLYWLSNEGDLQQALSRLRDN